MEENTMNQTQEGEMVSVLQFRVLIHSYITEILSGMRVCRIPLSHVAPRFGVTTKNKRKALAQLLANYEATMGEPFEDSRLERIFG
jgi:hypothetical protein